MATETNENRRDIIEIKSHLGLPTDPYRELPEFDHCLSILEDLNVLSSITKKGEIEEYLGPLSGFWWCNDPRLGN
jgi:hypothetical protein